MLRLKKDVLLPRPLPYPVLPVIGPDDHEVARDVRLLGDLLILLHEGDNELSFGANRDSELRVVEPAVVGVVLNVVELLQSDLLFLLNDNLLLLLLFSDLLNWAS